MSENSDSSIDMEKIKKAIKYHIEKQGSILLDCRQVENKIFFKYVTSNGIESSSEFIMDDEKNITNGSTKLSKHRPN